jgi:hypothetical protein
MQEVLVVAVRVAVGAASALRGVGFANSGGLVFVDEAAEEVVTPWVIGPVEWSCISAVGWDEVECGR